MSDPDPLVAPVVGGTLETLAELVNRLAHARWIQYRADGYEQLGDAVVQFADEILRAAALVPRPEPRADTEDDLADAIQAYRAEVARLKTIGLNQYGEVAEPREPEPVVDWFSAKRAIEDGIRACQYEANECERSGRATSTPELIKSAENYRVSARVLEAYIRQVDAAVRPASAPSLELAELEAFHRWSRGERFCCSTGIDDGPTYGYGNLDGNGFWEFPLPPEFVERLHAASAPSLEPTFPKGHPALCYELCDPTFEVTPHIHTSMGVYIVEVEP